MEAFGRKKKAFLDKKKAHYTPEPVYSGYEVKVPEGDKRAASYEIIKNRGMYVCMYVCICMYVCMCVCMYVYVCICMCLLSPYTHTHTLSLSLLSSYISYTHLL
jgi:hypothetical protein